MQKICILTVCFLLSSCVIFKNTKKYDIKDFPVDPPLKDLVEDPIIEKKENNFLVTKDFVTNSVLLGDYYKRLKEWKKLHKVY